MFNYLHSLFHRPERGWDPVPPDHAESYAAAETDIPTGPILDALEARLGSLQGRRVLDLGGGPGQFSIGLARRGAAVTWHDVSGTYLGIAEKTARENGLEVEFSLGYLEEARKWAGAPFDLVFCRICWYYCMNDRKFAEMIHSIIKPGGAAYIVVPVRPPGSLKGKIVYDINRLAGLKIGHPFPPPGRVAGLFKAMAGVKVECQATQGKNEKIWVVRS